MVASYQFLHHFLSNNRRISELSQINHNVYFRDIQGRCLAVNDTLLHFMGLDNPEQITQYELCDFIKDPLSLDVVLTHDQIVFDNKCTKVFQESTYIENKWINFLSIKSPLIRENKLIGLWGIALTIDNYNFSDFHTLSTILTNLFQEDYFTHTKENLFNLSIKPTLTPRELECLHLYMRGYTTKNIALLLKLSNRTIEFYIDNIKNKFGVNKRSELLPLAFNLYPELIDKKIVQRTFAQARA